MGSRAPAVWHIHHKSASCQKDFPMYVCLLVCQLLALLFAHRAQPAQVPITSPRAISPPQCYWHLGARRVTVVGVGTVLGSGGHLAASLVSILYMPTPSLNGQPFRKPKLCPDATTHAPLRTTLLEEFFPWGFYKGGEGCIESHETYAPEGDFPACVTEFLFLPQNQKPHQEFRCRQLKTPTCKP